MIKELFTSRMFHRCTYVPDFFLFQDYQDRVPVSDLTDPINGDLNIWLFAI